VTGWNAQGPLEVRRLLEDIEYQVEGNEKKEGVRQVFPEFPFSGWDNHFSGNAICNFAGNKGWPILHTTHRDRLPGDIPKQYLHKEKSIPGCPRAQVARMNAPITVVKTFTETSEGGDIVTWNRVHVSFQSTSSTNIHAVNALNQNRHFVLKRERGMGASKRKWAIQMNDARQLYLAVYGRIDTIDSL
jgi:hypothetical protein